MSSRRLNSFSASMCGYVLFCCFCDQVTLCFFFSASGVRRLVIQGGNISVLVACQNEMHNSYFYTDLHIHKHQSGCVVSIIKVLPNVKILLKKISIPWKPCFQINILSQNSWWQ